VLDHEFRPSDKRGFVHKRIGRAIGGFIGGGPIGAIGGFVGGGGGGGGTAQTPELSQAHREQHRRGIDVLGHASHGHIISPQPIGRSFEPLAPDPCQWPARTDPNTGQCSVFMGREPGLDDPTTGAGAAVMGRYGAALHPVVEQRMHRECLPAMVLGNDGLCYNRTGKGSISNRNRAYPKGRAPLLTGGQRNCITTAKKAATALEKEASNLEDMGMLKRKVKTVTKKEVKWLSPPKGGPSIINVE